MNLLLLVPDGVGVRNFILGDFLRQAVEKKGQVYALHVSQKTCWRLSDGLGHKVQWQPLVHFFRRSETSALRP